MTAQQRLAEKYAAQAEDTKRRPLHHSPLFWGGVVLFVLAIAVYVFTDALAWLPRRNG
jgi:ABC-type phosphate transport system permease subunit